MVHQQNYTQTTYGYELNASNSEVKDMFDAFTQAITSGEIAFSNGLVHFVGHTHDGVLMDNWIRDTACLKKFNSSWLITNVHQSVPLDENTMKGLLNLKPDLH